jgi:hypothetical protein
MKVFLTIIGGIALGLAAAFTVVYGVGLIH